MPEVKSPLNMPEEVATESKEQAPKPKSKPRGKKVPPREVKYPEFGTVDAFGETALTAEKAREILGWTEVDSREAGQLKDVNGKWINCTNNAGNRPIDREWAMALAQDMLSGHWAGPNGTGGTPNGETVVLGKTGRVLSAQHRLVALVLASQMWEQQPHWQDRWPTSPVLDTLIAVGVDEDGHTTRTLDNVKPRSLADVLFADLGLYGDLSYGSRQRLCTIAEHAVRMLWHRTGAVKDAFTPRQTHSEAVDWIDRHQRVKKAVHHIWSEDGGARMRKYLTPGYAAAMLYLMGCSSSGGDDDDRNQHGQLLIYADAKPASNEKVLDWSMWDKACEFWTLLAGEAKEMEAVRLARRPTDAENGDEYAGLIFVQGEGSGSRNERLAVVAKAWAAFRQGRKPSKKDVRLDWEDYEIVRSETDQTIESMHYRGDPKIGGIDIGGARSARSEDSEEGDDGAETAGRSAGYEAIPTPEEVERNKRKPAKEESPTEERERRERLIREADERRKTERAAKAKKAKVGSTKPIASQVPCPDCDGTGVLPDPEDENPGNPGLYVDCHRCLNTGLVSA